MRWDKPWYEITADDLAGKWYRYFERMLGDTEITEMNIEDKVNSVAKTEGQAKSAIACWAMIKAYGWEKARDMSSNRTWYRNLKLLREAGLSDADLSTGNVVFFRRTLIQFQMVDSWEQLRRLRNAA